MIKHAVVTLCFVFSISTIAFLGFGSSFQLYAESARNSLLAGTVTTEQGTPVVGFVNVFRLDTKQGILAAQSECATLLEADGGFNCASLPSGFYAILVYLHECPYIDPHAPVPQKPGQNCFPFIAYPFDANDDPMSLLHLQSGESLPVRIVVHDNPGYELHVEPANDAGFEKLHVYWQVGGASIPIEVEATRNADRQFVFQWMPQATLRLVENWYWKGTEYAATAVISTSQSAERNILLAAAQSISVSGRVQYKTESESRAKELACESGTAISDSFFTVPIDTTGAFSAAGISPGVYHCKLNDSEGSFIKRISIGRQSFDGNTVNLQTGESTQLLIEAGYSTAHITGSLEGRCNSNSLRSPGIIIRSNDSTMTRAFKADADGKFQVQGLEPGTYRIYGWADIDKIPYRSIQFLQHYDEKSTEISLAENSSATNVKVDYIDCD